MTAKDWKSAVLSSPFMKTMADNLNASAKEMDPKTTPIYNAVISQVGPEGTVIDIGAGVGRFAIPLAQAGIKVTAIEPSDEMRRHLFDSIERNGLSSRINTIPSSWPVDDDLHADVIFASLVIQFSSDPEGFIRAMERSASKRCILSVHVDQPLGFLRGVWQVFRPSEAAPTMLTFPELYTMMLNEGIIADVTIVRDQHIPGEAMEPSKIIGPLADLLGVKDSPEDMGRLREILKSRKDEILKQRLMRSAIVSWQPGR